MVQQFLCRWNFRKIYIFNRDYVNSTLQDASNKEAAGIAIVVLVLVVSPIIIILVRNAVATIQVSKYNYSIFIIYVIYLLSQKLENLIQFINTFENVIILSMI